MDPTIRAFLDDMARWTRSQADIRAVLLVGSQARVESPADDLSDVDLALFVDDPERYLRDAEWMRSFGQPLLTFLEPTAVGGFKERRVLFRDGLEVDFSILPAAIAEQPPPEADAVLARGFVILYDGIGLAPRVAASATPSPRPTQEQLGQLSNDFWYHLLWSAKKLRRGEVLLAKQACDCYLTERIVQLVRWRAHCDVAPRRIAADQPGRAVLRGRPPALRRDGLDAEGARPPTRPKVHPSQRGHRAKRR